MAKRKKETKYKPVVVYQILTVVGKTRFVRIEEQRKKLYMTRSGFIRHLIDGYFSELDTMS